MKNNVLLEKMGDWFLVTYFIDGKSVSRIPINSEDRLIRYVVHDATDFKDGVEVSNRLTGGLRGITDAILASKENVSFDYQSR